MTAPALYDDDFFSWTQAQAGLLRRLAREGADLPLDREHLAEEIDSLGKRDRRGVRNKVHAILVHLLKLKHSSAPGPRRCCESEVREQRRRLRQILDDSPSLGAVLAEAAETGFMEAVEAARDGLTAFGEDVSWTSLYGPDRPPFTPDQVLAAEWFPEPVSHASPGSARIR